jgi:hypothetical protein
MVLGTTLPGENPPKLLFLTLNLCLDGTVAYFSLKKYLFFRFRAYLSLGKQAPHLTEMNLDNLALYTGIYRKLLYFSSVCSVSQQTKLWTAITKIKNKKEIGKNV